MDDPESRRQASLGDLDREARRLGSLSTLLNRAVAEFAGLHPTDWECLDVLDWSGPVSAGVLAEKLGLTTGAVTGVLDRLEQSGWVRRERDPEDRRRVVVTPVWERAADLAPAFAPLGERVTAIYEELSERDIRTLLRVFRQLNQALEEATAQIRSLGES